MEKPSWSERLWLVQDFDLNTESVWKTLDEALCEAERIVGNRSAAMVPNMTDTAGYLYGPGDGSTRVMVRRFSRKEILGMDIDCPIY